MSNKYEVTYEASEPYDARFDRAEERREASEHLAYEDYLDRVNAEEPAPDDLDYEQAVEWWDNRDKFKDAAK